MISYAQNFEDVMLARLFPGKVDGFYIDIGASHPTDLSVTKYFYDLGWKGVNVEPIESKHALFLLERSRDVNVGKAIGRPTGNRQFFEVLDFDALSTFDSEQAATYEREGHRVSSYPVQVVDGASLFSQLQLDGAEIDFLKIDVEGLEGEVLSTLDFVKHRPKALVIESTRPASGFPGWDRFSCVEVYQEWEPIVIAAGYRFAHFDGISRFYVRQEDSHLVSRLALPPGFFDDIYAWRTISYGRSLPPIITHAEVSKALEEIKVANLRTAALKDALEATATPFHQMADAMVKLEGDLANCQKALFEHSAVLSSATQEINRIKESERLMMTDLEQTRQDRAAKEIKVTELESQCAGLAAEKSSITEQLAHAQMRIQDLTSVVSRLSTLRGFVKSRLGR